MPLRRADSLSAMCVCTIKAARERTLNPTVRSWLSEILEKHIQLERYVMTVNVRHEVYKVPKLSSLTKTYAEPFFV